MIVAYALMAAGCVAAGIYGLMLHPAPKAYLYAIGCAFTLAMACHGVSWPHGPQKRKAWIKKALGLCAVAVVLASLAWVGTGERQSQRLREQESKHREAVRKVQEELAKLEAQRAGIKPFRPTTAKAVAVFEAAIAALTQNRLAECARQSRNCQVLAEEERSKQRELDAMRADLAATEAAKRLDASAAAAQADLAMPPPVIPTEFHELTGLNLADGAANFVLLLALTLTASGALAVATALAARRQALQPAPAKIRRPWYAAMSVDQVYPTPIVPGLPRQRAPHTSALVTLEGALFPEGDVHAFASECVRSSRGKTTRIQDIFQHYRDWCGRQVPPRPPVNPEQFGNIFKVLCEKSGASIRCVNESFYADNLELNA